MKAIINANIVLKDHYIMDGVILIDGDKIASFGKKKNIVIPENAEIIDAENHYVGPGLIDVHTHAADNKWIFEEPEATGKYLLSHGVTGVLPALYNNLNKEAYIKAADNILKANEDGKFDNFVGFYMEGPYLSPNFGCERDKNAWKDAVVKEEYIEIVKKVKNSAKVWCFAPEREGIEEFVKDVKAEIPNIVFAVAHSEAPPHLVEKFIPYGLKIATHHTNATGTIPHYSECRGVCVDEAVNYNREIYAELISDKMGIHVLPYMQRLVRRIKGDDRIILIADQFVCDGPIPPGFEEATDIHFDDAGEIAGSGLTLDVACSNFILHTGCSVCDAFKFGSYNPARALNLAGYGYIDVGNVANLVFVDDKFNVKKVIFKGEKI
ncbi:MAG: amidohydrolase family protein [Clostridia bacterium]|nr:amidohydrolase family protein [Clostridia bacterium]